MLSIKPLVQAIRHKRRLELLIKAFGRLETGSEFVVGPQCFVARGASLRFGNRVSVGSHMTAHNNIIAADDIMISSYVAFIGNDHEFDRPGISIVDQSSLPRSTTVLEGDNLIGFGSILLGNITIGKGAIVAAGSLVTKNLEPFSVYAGRPASFVRKRARTE